MKRFTLPICLLFVTAIGASLGCGGRTPRDGEGESDGAASGGTGSGGTGGGGTGTGVTGGTGSGGTGTGGSGGTGTGGSGGTGIGGSGGTGIGGTGGGGATDCRPRTSPTVCTLNPSGQFATPNLDAFRAAISQRWLLCGTQSIFSPSGRDIGLEITTDGHWYRLFLGSGGGTVRGAGFDEEGTWDTVTVGDGTQPYQLNFHIFGSGMIYTRPALAETPRAMRLNNNGVLIGNYVLDPSVPSGGNRCP